MRDYITTLKGGLRMRRATLAAAYALSLLLLIAINAAPGSCQTPAAGHTPSKRVTHQLRIYEIFDVNKKVFHERFRDHAMRIMARYDFNIVATWESRKEGRTEFVYLLEWPDTETMKDRWAKFLADEEWIEIKKATGAANGQLVGEIQDRTLELTDYSPRSLLAN
jgi:hypothetical protein